MTPDSNGFALLWPTRFLRRELPGFEQANAVLLAHIEALDASRDAMTTGYREQNLFASEHPAVRWLQQCVAKTALDFLTAEGVDASAELRLHGWANVNRHGDYHDLHNHPHSYLSGTYYVAVPAQPANRLGRRDQDPGAISFYDPRPQANMTAIAADGQIDPEVTILPTPGTIMMWPSFVHHLVHPNLAEAHRVSVSFNVVVANASDLLPGQL